MKNMNKRGDVMQAALELIAEQGFHGAPMADIAKKAGVAAGTIYLYFENKDVLINELHRDLEDKMITILQTGYPFEKTIRDKFLHLIRGVLRYCLAHPLHFQYMEQYFSSPYGISLHRQRLMGKSDRPNILMDLFEQGIAQQMIKELPKAALFSLAFAPLTFLIRDHILGFIDLDETLIQQITEACWDAVKK